MGSEATLLQIQGLKSKLYDQLYDEASAILKKDNPCNMGCNTCTNSQVNKGTEAFCCSGCKYLGADGCTVNALSCRVWLCFAARRKHPETAKALDAIGRKAWDAGIPSQYRGSKQDHLKDHHNLVLMSEG